MGASEIMPNKHIRVYELAKELNKTSKEIMAVLAEKNIEVTTHMATLEDNQAELVRGAVGSGQQEAKKEGAAPAKKKVVRAYNRQVVFQAKTLQTDADIDDYEEKIRSQLKQLLKNCDEIKLN